MDTLTVFISSNIREFASERKTLKAALERWPFVHAWVLEERLLTLNRVMPATCDAHQKQIFLFCFLVTSQVTQLKMSLRLRSMPSVQFLHSSNLARPIRRMRCSQNTMRLKNSSTLFLTTSLNLKSSNWLATKSFGVFDLLKIKLVISSGFSTPSLRGTCQT